jgi:putative FmdB family regulatory protein
MPIFEYRCKNDHVTERIELVSRNELTMVCPVCQYAAHKIVSNTSWQWGDGPKQSNVSAAIQRVKKAEREGRA